MATKRTKLKQHQIDAIELLITKYRISDGYTNLESIAKEVGVERQTLYNWMYKNDLFIEEYERRVRERSRYSAGPAINRMHSLLDHSDGKVQLGAAKDLLDRAGYKPTEKISVEEDVPVVIMGVEALED